MMEKRAKIQFRPGEVLKRLEERSGPTAFLASSADLAARRDLERYYRLLADSLPRLELGEAMMLVDMLNGTVLDERTYRYLAHEVADSLADGLGEKWGVDGSAFVARLQALPPGSLMAIVDAVERFWLRCGEDDAEEVLRDLGLCGAPGIL